MYSLTSCFLILAAPTAAEMILYATSYELRVKDMASILAFAKMDAAEGCECSNRTTGF